MYLPPTRSFSGTKPVFSHAGPLPPIGSMTASVLTERSMAVHPGAPPAEPPPSPPCPPAPASPPEELLGAPPPPPAPLLLLPCSPPGPHAATDRNEKSANAPESQA